MKYLNILNSSFAVAVAVVVGCFTLLLDPCCLAAAINDEGLASSASLPLDGLLPPLSDADFEKEKTSSSINTATTTKETDIPTTTKRPPVKSAPAMKPTKSLKNEQATKMLQQQQQQKEKNKQQLQIVAIPVLDLNPEVPPPELSSTDEAVASVKVPELKQAASVQHKTQTKYQTFQQQLKPQKRLKQQQKQQFVKQLPTVVQHKLQPQNVATINKVAPASAAQIPQEQREQHIAELQQIIHPTTRHPPRGALPTLTPFPRHLK